MTEHVCKQIELTGPSPVSGDEVVRNAIAKASKKIPDVRWFEVTDTRGQVDSNAVAHWQATGRAHLRVDHVHLDLRQDPMASR